MLPQTRLSWFFAAGHLPLGFRSWNFFWNVTIGLIYSKCIFSTLILCRGVPSFATIWPCGVRCQASTTCLQCVGPLLGNYFKWQLVCKFDMMESNFLKFPSCIRNSIYFIIYSYLALCLSYFMSQIVFYCCLVQLYSPSPQTLSIK